MNDGPVPENIHTFTCRAMATLFQIVIAHEDKEYAGQCAHAAFNELHRLELELSKFIENSDISRINQHAGKEPVVIGQDAFTCIEECVGLSPLTGGAFDITAGPLIAYWKARERTGNPSLSEKGKLLLNKIGTDKIMLDKTAFTAALAREGMNLDLGGYGKGYAVDRMTAILHEWEIDAAVIHGGMSSVRAFDPSPGKTGWEINLRNPKNTRQVIYHGMISRQAVNGSGIGKANHIVSPRTGLPVTERTAAWVFSPSAAEGDAFSTAFMIMNKAEVTELCRNRPEIQAIVISGGSKAGVEYFNMDSSSETIEN